MADDSQNKKEFRSWRSYWDFARHVKENRRYVWDKEVQDFLDSVKTTRLRRQTEIRAGHVLWRAQIGVCRVFDEKGGSSGFPEVRGFPPERMKPVPEYTREGRANSKGIPVLYLASLEKTAVSETRPWVGSEVSLAKFKVLRKLNAIDLTKRHQKLRWELLSPQHYFGEEPEPQTREDFVWSAIDNAFSRPVSTPEDVLNYIPTQILAELFLSLGYDAILYRSQFGEGGTNVAVFDLDDAEVVDCKPLRVSAIDVDYRDNYWEIG